MTMQIVPISSPEVAFSPSLGQNPAPNTWRRICKCEKLKAYAVVCTTLCFPSSYRGNMSTIDPRRYAEPGFFFKGKESNSSDPGIYDSKDRRMAKKAFFRGLIDSRRSVRVDRGGCWCQKHEQIFPKRQVLGFWG
jgi:hypothetical protein